MVWLLMILANANANTIHIQAYMRPDLKEFWNCYDYYKYLNWELS